MLVALLAACAAADPPGHSKPAPPSEANKEDARDEPTTTDPAPTRDADHGEAASAKPGISGVVSRSRGDVLTHEQEILLTEAEARIEQLSAGGRTDDERDELADDAAKQLDDLLAKAPENARAAYARAALYLREGNGAEAERLARVALAHDDTNASYHARLGDALAAQDEHADAVAAFAKARDLDPAAHGLRYGIALLAAGRAQDAEKVFTQIADDDPEHFENGVGIYTRLGDAVLAQGRHDDAIKHYMRAQSRYLSDKMAHAGAARAYEAKGETTKAIDEWSAYIRRDCCSEFSKTVAQDKLLELKGAEP